MDFIIVDTPEQAKEVADFLTTQKVGRMTFLIKELIGKIDYGKAIKQFRSPPLTKRLFDLCQCQNDSILGILYWAIGNTLVTETLDTAMKVAFYDKETYRVVTSKGQLIDSSGAMTSLTIKRKGNSKLEQEVITKRINSLLGVSEKLAEEKSNTKRLGSEFEKKMEDL